MKFEDYFQREMLALRQLAREAMAKNPGLEPFFGTSGRDADVERVLESFTFLTARLQQKLDDDLPEVTYDLFNRLWPNYLRPLPAASVIQYQPANKASAIPRGSLVESVPVDGIPCRFRTIYDVNLLPVRIVDQRMIEHGGEAIMAVRFALTGGNLQDLALTDLSVFFTGEGAIPYTLYITLTHRLKELRFVIRDGGESREHITTILRPSCVKPLGFGEDEGMLPYPENLAIGYRVLQEYFCYPEKFLFVQISGLQQGLSQETRQRFQHINEFELHFVLDHLPAGHESFQAKNWNLFCTPVINIFTLASERQYPPSSGPLGHKIVPDEHRPDGYAVYSVEQVESWQRRNKEEEPDRADGKGGKDASSFRDNFPYRLRIAPTLDGEYMETYIQIEGAAQGGDLSVDLQLLCTNRDLPKRLGLGDIGAVAESAKASALSLKNILPVSSPLPPPHADGMLWRILSNMSLNSIPLNDVAAFRAMIAVYAFRAKHDSGEAKALEKRLQSIRAIKSRSTDRIFRGVVKRGAQTTITMDQTCFSCEGEMYLFGAALNEFLSMYATMNSFHRLIVREASRGEEYPWPARLVGQPPQ